VREIEKMGRKCVDSNQVFIDGLEIPVEDRIGEEGKGFEYILHGMNPERILIAAEAIGHRAGSRCAGAQYANERIVFDRAIGKNQGIQHPLAERWMELEAAHLMVYRRAAWLYDQARPCGAEANAPSSWRRGRLPRLRDRGPDARRHGLRQGIPRRALLARGLIPRIAPVSPQLILCFIAEKVLGLPKSY
jgi:acyl-CoA dehydrogenase